MTDDRYIDPVTISLNDIKAFDEAVHGKDSLPFASPIRLITKDNGTELGRGIGCLTFLVQLPDGTIKTAQAVTTVRLLRMALACLVGRYDEEGRSRFGETGAN